MKLVEMNCPNCGAQLKVDSELKKAKCEYCDSLILIAGDQAREQQYDDPEEAGYRFEKGRQRALREAQRVTYGTGTYTQPTKPEKRHLALWVLGWLFIFPLPLTLITARSKKLPSYAKWLIIVAAWLIYFGWIASSN